MTSASGLPTVACVVITKNEEANIPDCLNSVQWADELVVVDAESCDKTVELARARGANVSIRPWPGFGLRFSGAMMSRPYRLSRTCRASFGSVACLARVRGNRPVPVRSRKRNRPIWRTTGRLPSGSSRELIELALRDAECQGGGYGA